MTEATASAPCCGNCRYSVVNGQLGTCHRYAPKPDGTGSWAAWPLVQPSDWCGEWALPPEVDLAPPTLQDLQDMAHYLAQNPPLPHGNTPPLSASDQQEAPPITYDQYDQFEDPLA